MPAMPKPAAASTGATTKPRVGLLVLDLDNTVWDWFEAWQLSFNALLDGLVAITGISRETLKAEIKRVHEVRGTTEYSFLLEELPSVTAWRKGRSVEESLGDVVHNRNSLRFHNTALYPGVLTTLQHVKSRGVQVVAYTESLRYWTEWRVRLTQLDGVIDVLYSSPDHDFPVGVSPADVRTQSDETYEIKYTAQREVERGIVKPDPRILSEIVAKHGQVVGGIVYVGDSLDKDIAMAQLVGGIYDVHAEYGEAFRRPEYDLIREVTHWPKDAVDNESSRDTGVHPTPTYVLNEGFSELLELFEFGAEFEVEKHLELWKTSVSVQMHFNDIGWRIRALALTALTFILGATGLVYANTPPLQVGIWHPSLAALVPLLGALVWWAFWFMDARWFHQFLAGSVSDGSRLESLLNQHGVRADLGGAISKASPTSAWPFPKVRRSAERLDLFYRVIGIALGAIVLTILLLGLLQKTPAGGPEVVINNVPPVAPTTAATVGATSLPTP
jgi:FMN phosphatase YigB (HAD superfamily)